MIIINGGLNKGLEISQWLKNNGLVHGKDYTWYRKSRNKDCPVDRLIFDVAVTQWESMIAMKWASDVG